MPDAQGKPTDAELRAQIISALSTGNAKPSKAEDLEILRDPNGNPLGYRDLATGSYYPIPAAREQPTPTGQLDRLDVQGRLIPPEDTTTPVAKLRDPRTGTVTDLPSGSAAARPSNVPAAKDQRYLITRNADGTMSAELNPNYAGPADEKSQLQPFGDQLLRVAPDGSVTVIASKSDQPDKPTTVAFGDTLYSFDGTKVTALISKPKDPEKPITEVRNGKTFQWDPSTKAWTEAAGLPSEKKPVAVSTNTAARELVGIDEQGNVVSREPNPNFVQPTPTQLTPDLVSPNVPLLKPDGTIDWVPNQNRVPASQAMLDLLEQANVRVNGGQLSMADAKDLLTGAVNTLNAQTAQTNAATAQQTQVANAAQTVLSNQQQNAQTGAGLLQNRVSNAQGMLQSVLGLAGQGQRSGNMGGGLMNAPAGLGEALVGGIQGWATELGGGQGVYDTAARLVQSADPQNGRSPEAQAAYGVLTQMLERYKGVTGQDHPAVMATQAARESQQQNAFVPPPAFQAQYDPRFQPQLPQQPAGTVLPPGVAGTVPPGDPRFFTAPVTVPLGV